MSRELYRASVPQGDIIVTECANGRGARFPTRLEITGNFLEDCARILHPDVARDVAQAINAWANRSVQDGG